MLFCVKIGSQSLSSPPHGVRQNHLWTYGGFGRVCFPSFTQFLWRIGFSSTPSQLAHFRKGTEAFSDIFIGMRQHLTLCEAYRRKKKKPKHHCNVVSTLGKCFLFIVIKQDFLKVTLKNINRADNLIKWENQWNNGKRAPCTSMRPAFGSLAPT